jgi:hypothetical protein
MEEDKVEKVDMATSYGLQAGRLAFDSR